MSLSFTFPKIKKNRKCLQVKKVIFTLCLVTQPTAAEIEKLKKKREKKNAKKVFPFLFPVVISSIIIVGL